MAKQIPLGVDAKDFQGPNKTLAMARAKRQVDRTLGTNGADNTPPLPPNPIKARVARDRKRDEPGIDKRDLNMGEGGSPRELSTHTKGPLVNDRETGQQFTKDIMSRDRRRRYSRDYRKRPLNLRGSRGR